VKWFSSNPVVLVWMAFLLAMVVLPGTRHEICPERFRLFMAYYRAAQNTNAPLTFRERLMYSFSQAYAAREPQPETTARSFAF
jgi:hypothetical protein